MKKKVSISWSGGKDSAFALYNLLQDKEVEVVSLHTSFNDTGRRVGMHGTPEILIEAQAAALALPLHKIYIPADSSNASYEKAMLSFYRQQKEAGITAVVFGDIFLEDLKAYRNSLLEKAGMETIYPLWGRETRQLITDFLEVGFKTTVCAANGSLFEKEVAGSLLDQDFLDKLPAGVDPCGEKGEFHTFVHEGPVFSKPLRFRNAGVLAKSYSLGADPKDSIPFWFADLKAEKPLTG